MAQPQDKDDVLVLHANGQRRISFRINGYWHNNDNNNAIVAWSPILAAPEALLGRRAQLEAEIERIREELKNPALHNIVTI